MINYLKILKNFYLKIAIISILFVVLIFFILNNPFNVLNNDYPYQIPSFSTNESRNIEANKLLNLDNFRFIILPGLSNFCLENGPDDKIIFIVTSYVGNIEARSAIRRTFPKRIQQQLGIRFVFLIGLTNGNSYISESAIEDESRKFNDLVQGNFKEAYRNLTYKHMMGLKYIINFCENIDYVVKMDDDIIVNVRKLLKLIKEIDKNQEFIAGYLLKNLPVKREPANKWFVPKREYSSDFYPDFMSGWLYITTPAVYKKLEQNSRKYDYFWIDDVFVTGILTENNLTMIDVKGFYTNHPEHLQCCLNDLRKSRLDCNVIVGPNGGRTSLFFEFNKEFMKCSIEQYCINRKLAVNQNCIGTKTVSLGLGKSIISQLKVT